MRPGIEFAKSCLPLPISYPSYVFFPQCPGTGTLCKFFTSFRGFLRVTTITQAGPALPSTTVVVPSATTQLQTHFPRCSGVQAVPFVALQPLRSFFFFPVWECTECESNSSTSSAVVEITVWLCPKCTLLLPRAETCYFRAAKEVDVTRYPQQDYRDSRAVFEVLTFIIKVIREK